MPRSILLLLFFCALWLRCLPAVAQSVEVLRSLAAYESARMEGNVTGALASGRAALAQLEADPQTDELQMADLLRGLGELHSRAGEPALSLGFYERALALEARRLGPEHPDLIPLLQAIAAEQRTARDYGTAERTLQRVLAIERGAYGADSTASSDSLARLRDVYREWGRADDAQRVEVQIERLGRAARDPLGRAARRTERRYVQGAEGYAAVRVFYGTNRARSGQARPAAFYGRERGALELGYVDVSIPESHRIGDLETQGRWTMMSYLAGPVAAERRYVLLQAVTPMVRASFLGMLREQVRTAAVHDIFIFVHGFNTSFEDAARRTAQLAYDLDYDGTPMMYSWPSQGSTTAYTVDESVVDISGRRMADFLAAVTAESGAERVHLIAHSMGNRTLLRALETFQAQRAPEQPRAPFGQIVFTAPDVDRDFFLEVVQGLRQSAARVTLYASDNDVALKTSQKIHGAPRAGLAGAAIIAQPGLDTIDMSGIKGDLLGHNYFAADSGAIYDLFRLLWRGEPPPQRCGMNDRVHQATPVWTFDVKSCEGMELMQAGLMLKRFGVRARARIRARLQAVTDPRQREEWTRVLGRLEALLTVRQ